MFQQDFRQLGNAILFCRELENAMVCSTVKVIMLDIVHVQYTYMNELFLNAESEGKRRTEASSNIPENRAKTLHFANQTYAAT